MARPTIKEPQTEMGRRLREAREQAGISPAELAAAIKRSVTSVYKYEVGQTPPPADVLNKISDVTGKAPEWLMARSPLIKDASGYVPEDIPLVGRGGAGRGQFSEDGYPVGEGWKRVHRPYDVKDPNAFAVEVVGDSMEPTFYNRDVVVCAPSEEWRTGRPCVVVKDDGECLVKQVHRNEGHFTLSSVNQKYPPIVVPSERVTHVFKIVWRKLS